MGDPVKPGLAGLLKITPQERQAMAAGNDVPPTQNAAYWLQNAPGAELHADTQTGRGIIKGEGEGQEHVAASLSGPSAKYSHGAVGNGDGTGSGTPTMVHPDDRVGMQGTSTSMTDQLLALANQKIDEHRQAPRQTVPEWLTRYLDEDK